MLAVCGGLQLSKATITRECSEGLWKAGMFFICYYAFFAIRNFCVCILVMAFKYPQEVNMFGRASLWFVDWIALSVGTVWATVMFMDNESKLCAATDEDANTFRKVLLAEIIFSYLYLGRIWCFNCLAILAGCCYCTRRQAEV